MYIQEERIQTERRIMNWERLYAKLFVSYECNYYTSWYYPYNYRILNHKVIDGSFSLSHSRLNLIKGLFICISVYYYYCCVCMYVCVCVYVCVCTCMHVCITSGHAKNQPCEHNAEFNEESSEVYRK